MSSQIRKRDLQSVKQIQQFQNSFISNEQRQCTDILCTIVGAGFILLTMLISFCLYNKQNYIRANNPTDSQGKICGIDYPGYSFVYFASSVQTKQRLCVSKCPVQTDKKLMCKATSTRGCYFNSMEGFGVEYYQNQPVEDRNGKFCLPTNQEQRNVLLQKSGLLYRGIYMNTEDAFITCSWIGIILGVIFGFAVQFFPKHVNEWLPYLGSVMLFILIICTFAYSTPNISSKILIGFIFILMLLLIVMTIFRFRKPIKYNGVLLQVSTRFIKQNPLVLINIPIFIMIFLLFEFIIVLQLNSVWTSASLHFDPSSSLYYQYVSGGAKFMTFLIVIQSIWLFFFIKQSFNFIISGYLALWYYKKTQQNCLFPYQIYFTKHIGSVFACSFMTGFFGIYDTVFDVVRSFCGQPQNNSVYSAIKKFLDLVRSQSLVYVIFSSNSYCNAARYCEYLCFKGDYLINNNVKRQNNQNDKNQQFSQSVSRTYRLSAYVLLGGFVSLLGLYLHGNISIYGMGLIILTTYFIINFIIQLHADSADSIMILYMHNQQFAARKLNYSEPNSKSATFNNEMFKKIGKDHGVTNQVIQAFQNDIKQRQNNQCWNCWNVQPSNFV